MSKARRRGRPEKGGRWCVGCAVLGSPPGALLCYGSGCGDTPFGLRLCGAGDLLARTPDAAQCSGSRSRERTAGVTRRKVVWQRGG